METNTVYRIAKWSDVYVTAESKRHKQLSWVALPIAFDSNGYQSMIDDFGDEAPAIYGAWCALVAVAAGAPERGVLASSRGRAFTPTRLARMTCFPAAVFERLFEWATDPGVQWLEKNEPPEHEQDSTSVQPAVSQPKTGLQNITQPNQTLPTAAAGDEKVLNAGRLDGDDWSSLDADAVSDVACNLAKQARSLDRQYVWSACCVADLLGHGIMEDIVQRMREGNISKHKAYIDKVLREEASRQGRDSRVLMMSAPPPPPPSKPKPPSPIHVELQRA